MTQQIKSVWRRIPTWGQTVMTLVAVAGVIGGGGMAVAQEIGWRTGIDAKLSLMQTNVERDVRRVESDAKERDDKIQKDVSDKLSKIIDGQNKLIEVVTKQVGITGEIKGRIDEHMRQSR